jgi:hypothetical protein
MVLINTMLTITHERAGSPGPAPQQRCQRPPHRRRPQGRRLAGVDDVARPRARRRRRLQLRLRPEVTQTTDICRCWRLALRGGVADLQPPWCADDEHNHMATGCTVTTVPPISLFNQGRGGLGRRRDRIPVKPSTDQRVSLSLACHLCQRVPGLAPHAPRDQPELRDGAPQPPRRLAHATATAGEAKGR